MFKILIDISTANFILVVFNKNNHCVYRHIRLKHLKNAELLPKAFNEAMQNLSISINQIQIFYVTIGPGSFTGCRVGLTFAKTLCQFSDAELYVIDTLSVIAFPKFTGNIYLDAKSQQVYKGRFQKGKLVSKIEIVSNKNYICSEYPASRIANQPGAFLSIFQKKEVPIATMPFYIKHPNIIMKEKK